jgi:recombination protein RecA
MKAKVLRAGEIIPFIPKGRPEVGPSWSLSEIAGRLVEISGTGASATLTAAFGLVLDAQGAGQPAAWVGLSPSTFFPPDAAEGGVDLDTLAVVRVANPQAAARSAEKLVRSGGFGLVVIDLGPSLWPFDPNESSRARIPAPLLTRLVGLAQKHGTAVVFLTEKTADAPSLASLVSLRVEARRVDGASCEIRILKDKRRGPGRLYREICRGPAGLH